MSTIENPQAVAAAASRGPALRAQFQRVRQFTEEICRPLTVEDCVIQSMPDASPTRWHLAHTTWFFETFLLKPFKPDYQSPNAQFEYLFNSYYNAVGQQFSRSQRGLLSRPTVAEVNEYRQRVEVEVGLLLEDPKFELESRLWDIVELGIHHEQQHQELMLTDIKHVFSCNPLLPAYLPENQAGPVVTGRNRLARQGSALTGVSGLVEIGDASDQFVFDNERPRHRLFLNPFLLQTCLVTNGEYLEFMRDRGYERTEHWLSLGWQAVQREKWKAPLYWFQVDGRWHEFTLRGARRVDERQPVCHVSYFEADAFARWRGCRLPLEAEWEVLAAGQEIKGNFVENRRFQPVPAHANGVLSQMFGDVWEWTSSPYVPYPGYKVFPGALGEYNGKFMCNQYVLRGGSCVSPQTHLRATYRNFFPPETRWQFTGIRLAEDDA